MLFRSIDHGIASVELVMEEALQDIPTIVFDIQERLKMLSESVAVDGKPRPGLPNRRLLWDKLKPQASTVRCTLVLSKEFQEVHRHPVLIIIMN